MKALVRRTRRGFGVQFLGPSRLLCCCAPCPVRQATGELTERVQESTRQKEMKTSGRSGSRGRRALLEMTRIDEWAKVPPRSTRAVLDCRGGRSVRQRERKTSQSGQSQCTNSGRSWQTLARPCSRGPVLTQLSSRSRLRRVIWMGEQLLLSEGRRSTEEEEEEAGRLVAGNR